MKKVAMRLGYNIPLTLVSILLSLYAWSIFDYHTGCSLVYQYVVFFLAADIFVLVPVLMLNILTILGYLCIGDRDVPKFSE